MPSLKHESGEAVPNYFGGVFVSVESAQTMQSRVNKAIDRAVGSMSMFTRGKARGKLRGLTHPCANFVFDVQAAETSVQCEDRQPSAAPVDGRAIELVSASGDRYALSHAFEDGSRMVQTYATEHGQRQDVYEFIDDGQRLMVHTSIQSKWLTGQVRYTLYFERDVAMLQSAER
ncbi:MAG: hypothetical protein H0U74_03265 [Bradymonadaceae bacterium]|nr:hypothetical protein [Lujinxingiaceae bacterium]